MAWLDDYKLEMNKDLLACDIILDSGLEVGLSWKTIYLGEKGHMEEKKKALHVEINAIRNQHNFTVLSNKYGRLGTGFLGGQKMWLFPVKNKTKSYHSNKKLMKSILRQKSFLNLMQSDTNADILTLDTKTG